MKGIATRITYAKCSSIWYNSQTLIPFPQKFSSRQNIVFANKLTEPHNPRDLASWLTLPVSTVNSSFHQKPEFQQTRVEMFKSTSRKFVGTMLRNRH